MHSSLGLAAVALAQPLWMGPGHLCCIPAALLCLCPGRHLGGLCLGVGLLGELQDFVLILLAGCRGMVERCCKIASSIMACFL